MGEKYEIRGYYDEDMRGLAESTTTNIFKTAIETVHTYCSNGDFVKITNSETGQRKIYAPDVWLNNIDMGEIPDDIKELS